MRETLLSLAAVFIGAMFIVYGGLLAWNPRLFLKFHDNFIDRSRTREVAWRGSNLDGGQAKIMAAGFVIAGVLFIYSVLKP